ncbi:hypothetical protein [Lysobacter gummosus]|uniref:hypothetical protein n=1 Tax=Lysobacter gummosus TaxID=262324 RepID=UPI003641E534
MNRGQFSPGGYNSRPQPLSGFRIAVRARILSFRSSPACLPPASRQPIPKSVSSAWAVPRPWSIPNASSPSCAWRATTSSRPTTMPTWWWSTPAVSSIRR